MDSEKLLVFLISSAASALSLLIVNVFLGGLVLLGNQQFNAYTSSVFVSLALNLVILAAYKISAIVLVKDNRKFQILLSFIAVSIAYSAYTFFVQPRFGPLNLLGAFIVAVDITLVQYFITKYSLKILSKDF